MAKRILAVILSAAMLPAVFSGCKDGEEIDSGGTETTASSAAPETTATTTTSAVNAAESPKSLTLLKNRERLGNGLITNVEALSEEGKCIALDSGFRITASRDASTEEIMSRISMYPERELSIVKEAECKYLLTGGKPLPEGSLVKVAVSDEKGDVRDSWAFQTTESFRVKSVYPADGSEYVSNNSGIEIVFSSPPDVKCASEYFTVTPAVAGKFQVHRNTLYYIPSGKMKKDTVYTVTVKKGFKSDLSGELEEDFTFEFKTERYSDGAYFYTYNGFSETFIEGDPMVIEVQYSEALQNRFFDLDLYRYEKAEDYKAVFEKFTDSKGSFRQNYTADVSGLEKVFTSSEKPIPNTSSWRPSFIMLPDNLEEGYYIADISVGNLNEQYLIQVNPISVYALSLGEEHAFFINDTKTGKPASGAEVSLTLNGKTVNAKADKNGVANINMGVNERSRGVLSVKYGDSLYIDYFDSRKADDVDHRDKYFMYLYTDRETYLTSDTVNVWGIILPRRDGVTIPKKLSLRFGESDEAGDLKEVTVAADGTFSSSFVFTDHRETWYKAIQLLDGDIVICEKRISIDDYVKPTYTVDVQLPDYAIMPQRNPIPMEITANYYEGTAAEGLTFEPSDIPVQKVVVTDANGHAEASIRVEDSDSWTPYREWIGARLTGVENAYSYFSDRVLSFYRDVMLETEYDKNTHSLTLNTTQLDFDKVDEFIAANKGSYYFSNDSFDILKGKPFDTEVKVNIKHWYHVKEKEGSYYDFIEKKTVDRYSYSYKTDDIGTFTAKTVNGKAVLENLPTTSLEGGYDFYFTYNDSLGQETRDREYYNNKEYSYTQYTSPFKYYSLKSTKDGNNNYVYDYDWYDYEYSYSNVYFKENEELEFELSCNKENSVSDSGRIFLAVYQNDFISENVYTSSTLKYSPALSCIPNAYFEGAYFDGRHVYPVSGGVIKFDPKERNVKLEVTSDRETYDAGDTVRLSVKAVDEKGRPLAGAPVMLSVVDEAAFAVYNQDVDVLNDAYRHIWYPRAQNYYSYIQHVIGSENMGEKGGGGDDDSVRDYFNDNPYFGSVITDSNGKAEFVFALADNLTTWRATLIAAKSLETGRILAGDTTLPIVAKRPLFITPIMLDTFIEGDDIAVTAKCHGIDVNDEITVKITGGSIEKTLSIKSSHTANFGKLPRGDYKVLFTAEKNGNRDAIELPLTVTDTILETDIYRSFDLSEGIDITPQKWPVSLTFFDKEYGFYTDILRRLAFYYGKRTDVNMAGGFARKELGYITEEDYIDLYKESGGFIKILPNAEESALYTALAAAAMPELIDRTAAVPKFNYMLESKNTDKTDTCIAYMGLAALGEPVLEEVKSALASGEFTDYYDCMRLTAALAMCGDYDLAYEYFVKLTPDISIHKGSDPEDITALVVANGNESREKTQLALIAASVLKLPEADYFARYLYKDKSTQYESCAPELVMYLKNYVPKVEGDAVFTYNLNGRTETVQLERYYGRRISFGEEQFKNADLKVQSGSVKAFASYIGRASEQGSPENIKVSKTLSGDFTVGSEVTVTIRARKWCSVDDVIPSCGRYSNSRIGQRISLYTDESGTASYKFRIVSEGEYVVESAVVQDNYDGSWGKSERTTILSGKKNEKN